MLLFVLSPSVGQGAAIALSVLLNVGAVLCDRRLRERNLAHLILGIMHLVALSYCLGPAWGAAPRPWLAQTLTSLTNSSALGSAFRMLAGLHGLRSLFGFLLVANEANLFIRWLLNRLQVRPGGSSAVIEASEYARGRVIGLLERMLIYFFVLNGQFGAVGFTLAAKGFTRFKELENRGFAEYVLIGTLLSSGVAMLIAVAFRTVP